MKGYTALKTLLKVILLIAKISETIADIGG